MHLPGSGVRAGVSGQSLLDVLAGGMNQASDFPVH